MQAIDNEFFEAYKRLDRLCSDIYGCRNGVSQYIEDMERVSYQGRLAIPSWEQAYKRRQSCCSVLYKSCKSRQLYLSIRLTVPVK